MKKKAKKLRSKTQTDVIAGKPKFFVVLLIRSRHFGVLRTYFLLVYSLMKLPLKMSNMPIYNSDLRLIASWQSTFYFLFMYQTTAWWIKNRIDPDLRLIWVYKHWSGLSVRICGICSRSTFFYQVWLCESVVPDHHLHRLINLSVQILRIKIP